jgi:hypothetical protein
MPHRILAVLASISLLAGCAGQTAHVPVQPEIPEGIGTLATRPPLSGPPGCTRAIAHYEELVDRDVSTGYLSQSVYNQIVADIAAGPRPACAAGQDASALAELARVRKSHGYR